MTVSAIGPQPRRAVGDADPTLGVDPGPDRRARSRRSAAGPRPRPTRPGRRSDARSSRAGVAGTVTIASIATSRSVILRARAIDTVAGDPAPGLDSGEPGPLVGDAVATGPPRSPGRRRRAPRPGSRRAHRNGSPAGPTNPTTRYVEPTLSDAAAIRLDAIGHDLDRARAVALEDDREHAGGRLLRLGGDPPGRRHQPAFDRFGRARPTATERASAGIPIPRTGDRPSPGGSRAGRTGRPASRSTSRRVPRAIRRRRRSAGGRRDRRSRRRWRAAAGEPSRPASATTTPVVLTVGADRHLSGRRRA